MSLLEVFVQELITENIIQNYRADLERVRAIYNGKYKKNLKLNFFKFKWELWKNFYVTHWERNKIHFNIQWIDYFNRLLTVPATSIGRNYVSKSNCLLCNTTFSETSAMSIHLEEEHHRIRLQYVTDKTKFENGSEIITEIKDCNQKVHPNSLKIELPIKAHLNATITVKNNHKKEMNIMDVVLLNPMIKEITMNENFDKGILVGSKQTVDISLHGYFENSATLVYPIVIIIEEKNSDVRTYILREIHFEVLSELSYLLANLQIHSTGNISNYVTTLVDQVEVIIPGIKPEIHVSRYKEKFLLQPHIIPKQFERFLNEICLQHPEFIKRGGFRGNLNRLLSDVLQIYPGINANNYYKTMEKLLHMEEYQLRVDIREYDMKSTLEQIKIKDDFNLYRLKVAGLAEDRPSLVVFDRVYIKKKKKDNVKYEGYVHRVYGEAIDLGLNIKFDDIFFTNREYYVEFGFNRRPLRVEKQALHLAHQHRIIPRLFPSKTEIRLVLSQNSLHFSNRQLNEEQKIAVSNIVLHKNYPFLIFGPPGTGKTVTVVESVYQLYKYFPMSRILICAPSNAAANEVAYRLIDIIPNSDIFRLLGNVYGKEGGDHRFKKLKDSININYDGSFYMPSMEELLKRRVILTTIVTAARLVNGGTPPRHFSHVFIDESGYATETQTLIPIAGILSSVETKGELTGQVILAGDPQQLGPRIHSSFAAYCGYGKSLLERLIKTCKVYERNDENGYDEETVTKLIKNYRSHKSILEVPNRLFYNNELIAAGNDFVDAFIGWEHLKNGKFPVIFHHVEGVDVREKDSPSFFNVQEIEVVVDYLSKIFSSRVKGMKITQNNVGVITPYKKQAEKLREVCGKKNWNSLLIGSVEQFQGKEKMVVIVSAVRSKNANKFEDIDQKCELGFLKNPKRFNVAVTRAKSLLIVIGNAKVLKTDNIWSSFIQHCKENKSVAGKPFN